MIDIWLRHKILEYCIDIFFREFFKNFIFPQLIPQIYLTFGNGVITIQDDKHSLSKKVEYTPENLYTYTDDVASLLLEFIEKYHYSVYTIFFEKLDNIFND